MSKASVSSNTGCLTLTWRHEGDFVIAIEVQSNGYAGQVDGCITEAVFRQFARALVELERKQSGEAMFASMIPGEFEVLIRALDNVGQTGVYGKFHSHDDRLSFRHGNRLSFGFEIDRSALAAFVQAFNI